MEKSRQIACKRIHLERVIGLLTNKYTVLQAALPLDYLMKTCSEYYALDTIALVCSAHYNMYPSIDSCDKCTRCIDQPHNCCLHTERAKQFVYFWTLQVKALQMKPLLWTGLIAASDQISFFQAVTIAICLIYGCFSNCCQWTVVSRNSIKLSKNFNKNASPKESL